jgi:hypothetical protein
MTPVAPAKALRKDIRTAILSGENDPLHMPATMIDYPGAQRMAVPANTATVFNRLAMGRL